MSNNVAMSDADKAPLTMRRPVGHRAPESTECQYLLVSSWVVSPFWQTAAFWIPVMKSGSTFDTYEMQRVPALFYDTIKQIYCYSPFPKFIVQHVRYNQTCFTSLCSDDSHTH